MAIYVHRNKTGKQDVHSLYSNSFFRTLSTGFLLKYVFCCSKELCVFFWSASINRTLNWFSRNVFMLLSKTAEDWLSFMFWVPWIHPKTQTPIEIWDDKVLANLPCWCRWWQWEHPNELFKNPQVAWWRHHPFIIQSLVWVVTTVDTIVLAKDKSDSTETNANTKMIQFVWFLP